MPEAAISDYLTLMHAQREGCFQLLANIGETTLWQKPGQKEWSIGENLDHLRVIYASTFRLLKGAYRLLRPIASLRRARPYQVEIDNVYRRPGFPQNVGWMWPPKYTPSTPVALSVLYDNLLNEHRIVEAFYTGHPADLLGHIVVWDPAIGTLNLIQALRVGIYHDEMHYQQISETLAKLIGS